jgi:hypothetical protein
MSVRTYIVESLLPGGTGSSSGGTIGGGDVLLDVAQHEHDGASHTGLLPIERISTAELDTTMVAGPDGTGGLTFRAGSADAMVPFYIPVASTFRVPVDRQALYHHPIVVDGALVVDGLLIGV